MPLMFAYSEISYPTSYNDNMHSIREYQYKIYDDSVRSSNFLGADNEDGIEIILSEQKGYSFHEFIDDDEPLCFIIDFDLLQKIYNSFDSKLSGKEILDLLNCAFRDVCLEIFPKWDKNSITITSSMIWDIISYPINLPKLKIL
ncbi:hypothetical protein C1645_826421 [Glomus cerebriforme]|uniref:Uncharacterized protein n=1 Tax=Glomus cerebriforme TaxID=658196 RepID=A0A397SRL5_9GLOM|nr:hypothetical protein C1645_826421 [Glomus cerebriforme]